MTQRKSDPNWECNHPSTSLAWVWDEVYHCYDCGELIGEDDDVEED